MTASLIFGPIIDRITATRAVPFFLLPKICALIIIWAFSDPIWAWPYLLLLGLNVGMTYTGLTALWAELYGLQHLGAIRSLIIAITVLASALGPPVMGLMIDTRISIENICLVFAIYCAIATIFIFVGLRTSQKIV
jgi:MFS family permease